MYVILEPSPTLISCIVLNVWMNAYMYEKEIEKERCYLIVMVPMVVGLVQPLLPNLNHVVAHGTHLWPLFYLHFYYPQYE